MIFGKRDVRTDLGEFSSGKCNACKNSFSYHFIKTTRFLVIFFMKLIPLGSHYEAVCDNCEDTQNVDAKTGRRLARENFKKTSRILSLKTALKLAATAIVIAAAVALPLAVCFSGSVIPLVTRSALDTSPETLKSLVSEDGLFTIQDREGNVLAAVQITDGVSQLTFYDDISVLVGEPGANRSFKKHEYKQEATNDTQQEEIVLVPIPDNPGILEDRYGIPVRIYHYDTVNSAMGYSKGVQDLSAIEYTPDKITYPFKYFSSDSQDPTDYQLVLYAAGNQVFEATFIPELSTGETNQFVILTVRDMLNGHVATETVYNFDETTIGLAKEAGLTQQSSAQDILDFLTQNAPSPSMVTDYEYYENTNVISKMSFSMQDANGTMQSISQAFDITAKNGYYIAQSAQEDQ